MPIQILPARLANQIAAGEVVERPASVVKELVENSLDAGATRVEIDIEKGGHKRISIRDNGSGIDKQELPLALSRHATSKISSLDDLEAICSLGFRGEALASISSVSRLTLTSRTAEQSEAWQAQCEGRDMQVEVKPAAHPVGTSIDVVDLFFNTPGRRKFLRTEKTEFGHIEDVIKRIAMSRFDVSFTLKHNGKLLRKYPALRDASGQLKRVQAVCGSGFADVALAIDCQHDNMHLHGWIAQPGSERAQNDLQFCFVNGRMMRDKLINHAVRQAYEGLISQDSYPAYALYIEVPPDQVDVNVHPAKHEVRFHQARLVHDFIYRVLSDALQTDIQGQLGQPQSDVQTSPSATINHDYIVPLTPQRESSYSGAGTVSHGVRERNNTPPSKAATQHYYQLMDVPDEQTADAIAAEQWLKVDHALVVQLNQACYQLAVTDCMASMLRLRAESASTSQPLLLPVSIDTQDLGAEHTSSLSQSFSCPGFDLACVAGHIILRAVPAGLRSLPWSAILPRVVDLYGSAQLDVFSLVAHAWSGCDEQAEKECLAWFGRLSIDTVTQLCDQYGDQVKLSITPVN